MRALVRLFHRNGDDLRLPSSAFDLHALDWRQMGELCAAEAAKLVEMVPDYQRDMVDRIEITLQAGTSKTAAYHGFAIAEPVTKE